MERNMTHRARSARLLGIVAGSLALAAAPVRAQGKDAKAAPPDTGAITPAMVAEGRTLFHGRGGCHACHGERLEGTPIAPTLRAHKWKDAVDGSFPQIYRVITTGVEGTAMVSHPGGIDDAQALALASYIWSVNNRGAKP
jgi:mono/diheme cytochrome c family protein